MSWTPELVFARLIEAADIEWRLPPARLGPAAAGGFWPGYVHSYSDMVQWGDKRLAEEREMRAKRLHPSAAELSRWEEVSLGWVNDLIPTGDRTLLRAYVRCIVRGRSFSAWCNDVRLNRRTAYRRIHRALERLATTLCSERVLLRLPDLERVSQLAGFDATDASGSGSVARAA